MKLFNFVKFLLLIPVGMAVVFSAGCSTPPPPAKYASPNDWVNESKAGDFLPLATEQGQWSEPKTFTTKTGSAQVKSKFVKHFGTTCVYDLDVVNTGKDKLHEGVTLGKENAKKVYDKTDAFVKLAPGVGTGLSNVEQRECSAHWGTSKDMNACAACRPVVYFIKL
jgi:hypothetical protein